MNDGNTIDIGIDLGTTNSSVAVLRGVRAEVIKNNEGAETTPSAVWADRRGRLHVGRRAKERHETDPDNTSLEFKILMGTRGVVKTLADTPMTPELLSAEVLRSLRADVQERLGFEPTAAVITVPAAFDLSAYDATRRAAELAGFRASPLLSEPAAAAHAYGFQSTDENTCWLVYDLGGGTFDAAVIRLSDGEFSVVRHAGDNHLGGKVIDWRIVDEILIPAAAREHRALADLSRGDPRWFAAVSTLKAAAERAKIDISRRDSVEIDAELLDDRRGRYEFAYELRRADVERLAEPIVNRSINLCRDVLRGLDIAPTDIEKLIMVGGQTAMPYLRDRLIDPVEGLGIPLEFDEDPMTVVARGAAVFAGAQLLDPVNTVVSAPGTFSVELVYPPMSPDTDPVLNGRVSGPIDSLAELSVELVDDEADPPWRSGRIALNDKGHFSTTLWASTGRRHVYRIKLTDRFGASRSVIPDRFSYTVGGVETAQRLGTTVGVGLDGNRMVPLIERGSALPAENVILLRTTVTVQRGGSGGMILIPVLEGDNTRGNRNREIGRLEVPAANISRTVPTGSEVNITVRMDTSRLISASAYVPLLDETFEHTINFQTETAPQHAELVRMAEIELARLAAVRVRQQSAESPLAELQLDRIDDEHLADDVTTMVETAKASNADALAAHKRILDLRIAIDAVEDELRWPELVEMAETSRAEARDLIRTNGSPEDQETLPVYEHAIDQAIESRQADLLRQRVDELQLQVTRLLDRGPVLQILIFKSLAARRDEMRNSRRADTLIDQGTRAIDSGQTERLRVINPQLQEQLPANESVASTSGKDLFSTVELYRE